MVPHLWPARLHHLRRDSPQPERLARFYGELLGDRVAPLPDASWLVAGRGRRLVAQGIGQRGPCVDYIRNTLEHMHGVGVRDPHLERILRAALALRKNRGG